MARKSQIPGSTGTGGYAPNEDAPTRDERDEANRFVCQDAADYKRNRDPLSAWIRATKPSRTDRRPKRVWGRGRR